MNKRSVGDATQLQRLSELQPPLLTIYLNMGPAHGSPTVSQAAHLAWLKNAAKPFAMTIPPAELQLFQSQLHRVEEFIAQSEAQTGSLVLFACPEVWEEVRLPFAVEPELHWGKANLTQLFWIVGEHKPGGIVAVDRVSARFFKYWCGEITQIAETDFQIDISQWKKKELGHQARPGIQKTYGTQRDTFEHRKDAQYARRLRRVAKQAEKFCESECLPSLFLVGSDRLIRPIHKAFSREFQPSVFLIDEDLAKFPLDQLEKHLAPKISTWQREWESAQVERLIGNERGAVVGLDETLYLLQNGKVRSLLIAQGFDATLRQCLNCGLVDHSGDPACFLCRSSRQDVAFRSVLPSLALKQGVKIETVSGDAADRLQAAGGVGAWLRTPKGAERLTVATAAR
jgi:hypothetical protein